jgi:hypothetical protein
VVPAYGATVDALAARVDVVTPVELLLVDEVIAALVVAGLDEEAPVLDFEAWICPLRWISTW